MTTHTISQASASTGVRAGRIYQWIRDGKLPYTVGERAASTGAKIVQFVDPEDVKRLSTGVALRAKPAKTKQTGLLSRREAVEAFGIGSGTITDWTRRGLPYVKVDNRMFFARSDLERFYSTSKARKIAEQAAEGAHARQAIAASQDRLDRLLDGDTPPVPVSPTAAVESKFPWLPLVAIVALVGAVASLFVFAAGAK